MKKIAITLILLVIGMVVLMVFIRSNDNNDIGKKQDKSIEDEIILENTSTKTDELQQPTEEDLLEAMVAKMSLDEKVGQVIIAGLEGTEVTEQTKALVNTYHVGGFIFFKPNLDSPEQALQLINGTKKVNQENDIPLFLAVDQEGGRVTRLPGLRQMKTNGEIGASYDAEFSYHTGKLLASQLHAYGLQMNFAPSVDINSNVENLVIGDRAFGDNPAIVSEYGVQMMKAMQEENIITSIKHFPGHGDTFEDSHEMLPVIEKTETELIEMELAPFQAAIDEGADMVMVAHILLPSLETEYPATMSKAIITDLLREKMGYDGVVITDDMTMGAIVNHYGLAEASVIAMKAGADIVLMAHGHENVAMTFDALKVAVESGDMAEEHLDKSVTRVLKLKRKYHLDDMPTKSIDVDKLNEEINELYESQ